MVTLFVPAPVAIVTFFNGEEETKLPAMVTMSFPVKGVPDPSAVPERSIVRFATSSRFTVSKAVPS